MGIGTLTILEHLLQGQMFGSGFKTICNGVDIEPSFFGGIVQWET